jgi:hypothetical protein
MALVPSAVARQNRSGFEGLWAEADDYFGKIFLWFVSLYRLTKK